MGSSEASPAVGEMRMLLDFIRSESQQTRHEFGVKIDELYKMTYVSKTALDTLTGIVSRHDASINRLRDDMHNPEKCAALLAHLKEHEAKDVVAATATNSEVANSTRRKDTAKTWAMWAAVIVSILMFSANMGWFG